MALGKTIIYATGNAGLKHQWDIGDNNLVYGLAVAWTFVDALKHAGTEPDARKPHEGASEPQRVGREQEPVRLPGDGRQDVCRARTFPMEQLESIRSGAAGIPRLEDGRRNVRQRRPLGRSDSAVFEGELRLPLVCF